jgi:hypothetical protein
METLSTLNVPLLISLLSEPFGPEALEKLLQQNPGGVTRLPVGLGYFTYDFEGDALIFTDETRQKIEAALGVQLQEQTYRAYRMETALDVPEPQRTAVTCFLRAWNATQAPRA